jgi:peptidyl-prolyl cis-trans isomerase A (cyclophilin A)/peptidyl-prolyl cis-trans isomerase B (cyclophilin B)
MSELAATLHTSEGDIEVELFDEKVPNTVENFVGLAEGADDYEGTDIGPGTGGWEDPDSGEKRVDPMYDDILFHRVIADFMIQTGDPTGTGRGGPGYTFDDEFHNDLRHDGPGKLSMANRGPNTNGSQFFITLAAQPHLDDKHAVFGEVTDGMDVVEAIGTADVDGNDKPTSEILLESVEIHD